VGFINVSQCGVEKYQSWISEDIYMIIVENAAKNGKMMSCS
jgi:hypothetical protein